MLLCDITSSPWEINILEATSSKCTNSRFSKILSCKILYIHNQHNDCANMIILNLCYLVLLVLSSSIGIKSHFFFEISHEIHKKYPKFPKNIQKSEKKNQTFQKDDAKFFRYNEDVHNHAYHWEVYNFSLLDLEYECRMSLRFEENRVFV